MMQATTSSLEVLAAVLVLMVLEVAVVRWGPMILRGGVKYRAKHCIAN